MTSYLSEKQILALHRLQISNFGGTTGLRDRGALQAAVARPQATFDGDDLYPDVPAKAAALVHSLIQSHPFVDGNKRVGAMTLELFLAANDLALLASDEELEVLILSIAAGELGAEELAIWIRQRSSALAP